MNENIKNIAETIRKALTIEVGSCHTDSIPLDERSAKIVSFYSKELATALDKAGYRKRTMMDRDKLAKLIDEFLTKNEDGYYCEQFADYLIANGIGDITDEKHRADVAEEALKNGAVGEDLYCSSDYERERLYLHLLKEAEERLKEEV